MATTNNISVKTPIRFPDCKENFSVKENQQIVVKPNPTFKTCKGFLKTNKYFYTFIT